MLFLKIAVQALWYFSMCVLCYVCMYVLCVLCMYVCMCCVCMCWSDFQGPPASLLGFLSLNCSPCAGVCCPVLPQSVLFTVWTRWDWSTLLNTLGFPLCSHLMFSFLQISTWPYRMKTPSWHTFLFWSRHFRKTSHLIPKIGRWEEWCMNILWRLTTASCSLCAMSLEKLATASIKQIYQLGLGLGCHSNSSCAALSAFVTIKWM